MKTGLALLAALLVLPALAAADERPLGDRFAIAIESANLTQVKALVEGGAAPDTYIKYGEHKTLPIIKASRDGRRDIVKYLLSVGANVNGKSVPDGQTALQEAASMGYDDVVEVLIAAGADVKAKDSRGNTPFQMAFFSDHLDVAELLIAKGVDVNTTGTADISPLQGASSMCNPEKIRWLVQRGAKVNLVTQLEYGGQTALMTAVRVGQAECVKTLLELGANPNLKVKSGETAVSVAKDTENEEVIKLVQAAAAKAPAAAASRPAAARPKTPSGSVSATAPVSPASPKP
jgi:ankyrin repeat protein